MKKTSTLVFTAMIILLVATAGIQNLPDTGKSKSASLINSGIFSPDILNGNRSDLSYLCYVTPIEPTICCRSNLFEEAPVLRTTNYFLNNLRKSLQPAEEYSEPWSENTQTSPEPILPVWSEPEARISFPKDEVLEAMYRKHKAEVDLAIEAAWESRHQPADEPLALENWMTGDDVWTLINPPKHEVDQLLATMVQNEADKVFESLERVRHLNELLTLEEEAPLQMEAWICEDITPAPLEKGSDLDPYLAKLLKTTNEEVFLVLQLQTKCRELLALDEEPALCLEEWMTDEACWCPDKQQREKIPPVSYAMKTNK